MGASTSSHTGTRSPTKAPWRVTPAPSVTLAATPAPHNAPAAPQACENRVGSLVVHIEVARVAVPPTGRPGLRRQVLDARRGGQDVGQAPGEGRRAHHADVQHLSSPPGPPGPELR